MSSNENIKSIIATVHIHNGTGKDSGKPYRQLTLTFTNGYQKRIFLDSAEWYMVDSLIEAEEDNRINVNVQE